jgi:hypothetical protein
MKRPLVFTSLIFLLTVACVAGLPGKTFAQPSATALPPAITATAPTVPTAPQVKSSAPALDQKTKETAVSSPPYGQRARQHLEVLSNEIGAREVGTQGETLAASYIEAQFKKMGYEPERQTFSFTDEETNETLQGVNIIAFKKGQSDRQIIVGAHYDSVDDGLGADDNASGVAVLLEAAESVKDLQTPYSMRFIAFDAEEIDLNGSYEYVSQMKQAEKNSTLVMINLDSLAVGNDTNIYGSADKLRTWALQQAKTRQLNLHAETRFDPQDPSNDFSDQAAFREAGIPFIYFEASDWSLGEQDGYTQVDMSLGDEGEIWHTPYDTSAYIDKTFPGRLDAHLNLYSTLLVDILTLYQE